MSTSDVPPNPPLDYSFQEINNIADLLTHDPNPTASKLRARLSSIDPSQQQFQVQLQQQQQQQLQQLQQQQNQVNHTSVPHSASSLFTDDTALSDEKTHDSPHPTHNNFIPNPSTNNSLISLNNSNSSQSSSSSSSSSTSSSSRKKYAGVIISGIRLAYNELESLSGLSSTLFQLIENPFQYLLWLDLSHNKLKHIHQEMLSLSHLSVLHLHGNEIVDLSEVAKLRECVELSKLTLHGNPLYQEKKSGLTKARASVIHALRDTMLKSLDFIAVTHEERKAATLWARQNAHGTSSKKKKKTRGGTGGGSLERRGSGGGGSGFGHTDDSFL